MRQRAARHIMALRHLHQQLHVLRVARGQRHQRGVGGQAVLDVRERERRLAAREHVAQVVDVGAVGQHVRDLEHVARLGVGVARHHHGKALAAQVVAARLAVPHAFDAARAIGQGDELLQELGVGVLDVV
ncbi:hypothetical protein D3C72_1707610 [compost metagenome]